jgi:hypothetical protein
MGKGSDGLPPHQVCSSCTHTIARPFGSSIEHYLKVTGVNFCRRIPLGSLEAAHYTFPNFRNLQCAT